MEFCERTYVLHRGKVIKFAYVSVMYCGLLALSEGKETSDDH